jgi:hypothetical protein
MYTELHHQPDVARLSFDWEHGGNTYTKSTSSISIGTSIEQELALFTLCFVVGEHFSF